MTAQVVAAAGPPTATKVKTIAKSTFPRSMGGYEAWRANFPPTR